jgi:hypothetical protein
MPGEERKFKRRRILAFVPVCKRERAEAASQAVIVDVLSSTGGEVDSLTGVPVGVAISVCEVVGVAGFVAVGKGSEVGVGTPTLVALGRGRESVDVDSIVRVEDGCGVEVDSIAGLAIVVGEERGVVVASASLLAVESSIVSTVDVSDNDSNVTEELTEANSVGESDVSDGANA